MTIVLEPLPYPYNSLEPFIDERTMRIHHQKHHQAYINKLNAVFEKNQELKKFKIEELLSNINDLPEQFRQPIINNGGGHANHKFFWPLLKKNVDCTGKIADAINSRFGSFLDFQEEFTQAASTHFGSGWTWLVVDDGVLEIMSTANQDSPLSSGKVPILAIDLWEHAYYLEYQNKRPEYINAFFNIINWEKVNENFINATKLTKSWNAKART